MCFYFLYICLTPPTHTFIGIKLFIIQTLILPHHDLFKTVIYNLLSAHAIRKIFPNYVSTYELF